VGACESTQATQKQSIVVVVIQAVKRMTLLVLQRFTRWALGANAWLG
jgi:hypothetical protein